MNCVFKFSQLRPLAGLLLAISFCVSTSADDVTFVIGDRMLDEGGDWNPSDSPLQSPFGIDLDSQGTMYIVELGGARVHRLPHAGQLETLVDKHGEGFSGDGGPAADAQFNGMHNCVLVGDERLLISDSWNHCVREIDLPSGRVKTIAGNGTAGFSGDGGPATAAQFDFLMCVAINPTQTIMHLADLKNRRVRNVDFASGVVITIAGNGKTGTPQDGGQANESPLVDPRAAASDAAGNLYILERNGQALRVVRPDGTIHTVAGNGKKGFRDGRALTAQFGSPKHLCCDPQGNVYIADDENRAIRKYDPATGQVSTVLGRGVGDEKIQLLHPHGVRYHDGMLYVVDTGHHRIIRLRPTDGQ